jgi:hypothetical protein
LLHRPLARIRDSGIVEETHVLSDLGQIAERTATAIKAFRNLTWTYCHGDCHGFNSRIGLEKQCFLTSMTEGRDTSRMTWPFFCGRKSLSAGR